MTKEGDGFGAMKRCLWCHGYMPWKRPEMFCCDECQRQWQQQQFGLKEKPTNKPINQE